MNFQEYISINKNDDFNLQHIESVCFCTHFMAFCKQSVKGSIMAIYRVFSEEGTFQKNTKEEVLKIFKNSHFVFQNNIQYLNSCWKSYFKKNDDYVVNKINLMIKFGKYLHPSCIFTHVWNFSQNLLYYVLARIELEEIQDTYFLSQCIDSMMDAILSFQANEIINRNYCCNEECEVYEYKEQEDFIKIKKI